MPTPEQILAGLQRIANQALPLAVGWHVLALAAAFGVAAGWRPSRRTVGVALALPFVSVAVMACADGNPVNGALFTVLALALGILGQRLPATATSRPPAWALVAGLGMIAFGLFYPHFLVGGSWARYLYAAPTGLVPCPTLSVAIGVALVADGLGSRAFMLVLACAGLFYGVIGAVWLGVAVDAGLIVGATGLGARSLMRRPPRP